MTPVDNIGEAEAVEEEPRRTQPPGDHMDEEEATEEEPGGSDTAMIDRVHHPAPVYAVKSKGAASLPRRAPAENNKGAQLVTTVVMSCR